MLGGRAENDDERITQSFMILRASFHRDVFYTDRHTDSQTDTLTDTQTDTLTDRQTNTLTDTQTDTLTD